MLKSIWKFQGPWTRYHRGNLCSGVSLPTIPLVWGIVTLIIMAWVRRAVLGLLTSFFCSDSSYSTGKEINLRALPAAQYVHPNYVLEGWGDDDRGPQRQSQAGGLSADKLRLPPLQLRGRAGIWGPLLSVSAALTKPDTPFPRCSVKLTSGHT